PPDQGGAGGSPGRVDAGEGDTGTGTGGQPAEDIDAGSGQEGGDGGGGCACNTTGRPDYGMLAFLLALPLIRRRRRG
ncbi:hypothetical protein L6V77_05590, partial [Myxococcota bacterium]|nr:hypothetical protein [Myxococcota bacterium]